MSESHAPAALLPEHWPSDAPAESKLALAIPWYLSPPAALAACLFPRRLGPYLAASSWVAAYAVHFSAILVMAGMIAASALSNIGRPGARSALVVEGAADVVLEPLAGLYAFLYMLTPSWIELTAVAIGVLAVETAVWVVALGLIVFFSAGERGVRTWLRGVKLLLWSTMALTIPTWGILYLVDFIQRDWGRYGDFRFLLPIIGLLGVTWWLTVLLRLGARYRGPLDGTDWQPRSPRCDACGYGLTGLMTDGRCPECGKPIAESMPECREAPPFARSASVWRQASAYVATLRAAMRTKLFGARLSVRRGWSAARRFALLNCTAVGVVSGVGLLPFWVFVADVNFEELRIGVVSSAFGGGLAAFLLLSLAGAIFIVGRRDMLRRSIVICYSSVWLVLSAVLAVLGFWAALWAYDALRGAGRMTLPVFGPVDRELVRLSAGLLCFTPALVDLAGMFRRINRLLTATRYASS